MPTLTLEQVQRAAERLDEAERTRRQMAPLTFDYPEMDLVDAHAVQDAWIRMKVARGARIRGRKVGLTSKAMQRAMNIGEPDYGTLLDDMFFGDGAEIEAAGFLDPRVEVEIAFVLSRPLAGENVTVEEVLAATEAVYPSLELIAARSYRVDPATGRTRTVIDTIADNAASAGVVLGARGLRTGRRGPSLVRRDSLPQRGSGGNRPGGRDHGAPRQRRGLAGAPVCGARHRLAGGRRNPERIVYATGGGARGR